MNVRMDSEDGLSEVEASVRLRQYGPNEIREEPSGLLRGVLKRFWGPIPWMLEVVMTLFFRSPHRPESSSP